MKRIKLLSSLFTFATLATSSAIIVTGCSNEKTKLTAYKWVVSNNYYLQMTDSQIIERFKDDNIHLPENIWSSDNTSIKITRDQTDIDHWVILEVIANSSSQYYKGSVQVEITNPIVFENCILYDNKFYELKNDINPNLFVTKDNVNTNGYLKQTLELKNGDTLEIGGSLEDWGKLTDVVLSSLNNDVLEIKDKFLYDCTNLNLLVLPRTCNITSIGNYFLANCYHLTNIDITSLTKVTSIGDYFLESCSSLRIIDLSGLSNLTNVGTYFLESCKKLTDVNLSNWSKVSTINESFMENCSNLTSIDLSDLTNVTSVGSNFLTSCKSLLSIDLSAFQKLTKINHNFLNECKNLRSINLKYLKNVTEIGDMFLNNCVNLNNIDLSPLANVTKIGSSFLSSCDGLKNIDLSSLVKIENIGTSFLMYCTNLESVTLINKDPTSFSVITNHFMQYVPDTCNLYTTQQWLSAYQETDPWKSRSNYIKVK